MKFGYTIIYVTDVLSSLTFLKQLLDSERNSSTRQEIMESLILGKQRYLLPHIPLEQTISLMAMFLLNHQLSH